MEGRAAAISSFQIKENALDTAQAGRSVATHAMNWFRKPIPLNGDVQAILECAAEFARSYNHDYIGVEHLFLAWRRLPPDHSAWAVLHELQIDLDGFLKELEAKARVITNRVPPARLPRTPRTKVILSLAETLARKSGGCEVSALHVFAAIIREGESLPARVLGDVYERTHHQSLRGRVYANPLLNRLLNQ